MNDNKKETRTGKFQEGYDMGYRLAKVDSPLINELWSRCDAHDEYESGMVAGATFYEEDTERRFAKLEELRTQPPHEYDQELS